LRLCIDETPQAAAAEAAVAEAAAAVWVLALKKLGVVEAVAVMLRSVRV
jgi:hypothetical protein